MQLERGYWTVHRHRGVPIRLHWTLPVGALVFGGLSPIFWLAFVGLVLLHETGHALLVRRYGHRVQAIDITGFGGMCRWSGHATERERSVIAWGGVGAQAGLLVVALVAVAVLGWPTGWIGAELAHAAIRINAILIVLNLLPFPPFDGAEAWSLFRRGGFGRGGGIGRGRGGSRERGPRVRGTTPRRATRTRRRRPAESWRYSPR